MVFAGDGAHCAVAIQDHPAYIRQTFRIDPAGDYGSEAMSSSSSSAPDRRQTMPNVTIWKRCGAAWRVVDVCC
jgi:hypothetical protein